MQASVHVTPLGSRTGFRLQEQTETDQSAEVLCIKLDVRSGDLIVLIFPNWFCGMLYLLCFQCGMSHSLPHAYTIRFFVRRNQLFLCFNVDFINLRNLFGADGFCSETKLS